MIGSNFKYHKALENSVTAFMWLFKDIKIRRVQSDETEKFIKVPIALSNRQKFITRIRENLNTERSTGITFPRIAVEIGDMTYDSSRKTSRTEKIRVTDTSGEGFYYNPVPYTMNLNMYVVSRHINDVMQIVEQIVPFFQPEFSLIIENVEGIKSHIPVVLNNTTFTDNFEGGFGDQRMFQTTLTFSMKLWVYGSRRNASPINTIEINYRDLNSESILESDEITDE